MFPARVLPPFATFAARSFVSSVFSSTCRCPALAIEVLPSPRGMRHPPHLDRRPTQQRCSGPNVPTRYASNRSARIRAPASASTDVNPAPAMNASEMNPNSFTSRALHGTALVQNVFCSGNISSW